MPGSLDFAVLDRARSGPAAVDVCLGRWNLARLESAPDHCIVGIRHGDRDLGVDRAGVRSHGVLERFGQTGLVVQIVDTGVVTVDDCCGVLPDELFGALCQVP